MACDPNKIRAALFEQTQIVQEIVYNRQKDSDRMALRMVPNKGTVEPNENNDVVFFGTARQASKQYRAIDNTVKALVAGDMNGRNLAGANGLFDVDINDIDDNACHGGQLLDFSQGFRRRGTSDREDSVESQIICTQELRRMDRKMVRGYFNGLRRNFARWGFDNFNDDLLNQLIIHSEAHTSILAANHFAVTTGGWEAPPTGRLSIWHLQEWKRYLRVERVGRDIETPMDWLFEIEAPVEDWIDAVAADQIARNPTGTRYEIKYLEDAEGPMRGRKYDVYGGLKCYFTEMPIRGYFKQTSASPSGRSFVRVYDWINEPDEVGGLVMRGNHQYDQPSITVGGVQHEMVTLIPHIDSMSFCRWNLANAIKPVGEASVSVNYQVEVRDGPYIDCNKFNDKFQLVGRNQYRFGSRIPEISGFLVYRHSLRAGYTIAPGTRDPILPATMTAGPEVYPNHAPDACSSANCAQCGQVADNNLDCVDPDTAPAGTLNLNPCGTLAAAFFGSAFDIVLTVNRTGDPSSASSVTWTSAHVTTNDSDFLDTTGLLEWAAGDNTPKEIVIPILAGFTEAVANTADQFTVTLSAPVGDALGTCTVATVNISDES